MKHDEFEARQRAARVVYVLDSLCQMRDIDKLKELLPEGHLLKEETVEEILCGNATLVIDWNEDGSIKDWGILD